MSAVNYEQFFTNLSVWKKGDVLTSTGEVVPTSCPWGRAIKKMHIDFAFVRSLIHSGYDVAEALPTIRTNITAYTTFADDVADDKRASVITLVNQAIANVNGLVEKVTANRTKDAQLEKLAALEFKPKEQAAKPEEPVVVPVIVMSVGAQEPAKSPLSNDTSRAAADTLAVSERKRRRTSDQMMLDDAKRAGLIK